MASHIFQYPQEVLSEINELIDKGASIRVIKQCISDKYKNIVPVPANDTIALYRKQYLAKGKSIALNTDKQEIQRQFNEGLTELDRLLSQIKGRQELNYSNVKLLQGLMGKCLLREAALEVQQASNRTPDMYIEKQMLAYISEARNYVKTIVQLTADLASQQAKLDELVKKETRFILQTVSNIVLQICPDRYEQFSRLFKQALMNESSSLNMEVAQEESMNDEKIIKENE